MLLCHLLLWWGCAWGLGYGLRSWRARGPRGPWCNRYTLPLTWHLEWRHGMVLCMMPPMCSLPMIVVQSHIVVDVLG